MQKVQLEIIKKISNLRIEGAYSTLIQKVDFFMNSEDTNQQTKFALVIEKSIAYEFLGQFAESIVTLEEYLSLILEEGEDKIKIRAYMVLASSNSARNNYDKSISYMNKALELAIVNDLKNELHAIYISLSIVYQHKEEYSTALEFVNKSAEFRSGNKNSEAVSLINSAVIYIKIKDFDKAYDLLKKAEQIVIEEKFFPYLSQIYINLATTCNSHLEAKSYLTKALKNSRKFQQSDVELLAIKSTISFYENLKDYENAYAYLKEYHEKEKLINNKVNIEKIKFVEQKIEIDEHKKEIENSNKKNKELLQINKKLIELLDIKNRLFSIIGHDLRGSVAAILSSFDLISNVEDLSSEKRNSYYEKIEKTIIRMQSFLDDILVWGQTLKGDLLIKSEKINLLYLTTKVLSLLDHQATNKKINIELNIPKDLEFFTDEFMLRTIIRNLLSNAIKYSFEYKSIWVNSKIYRNKVVIEIKDEGIGIDSENIDKIFKVDNNYSTIGTKQEKGNGFGLLLTQEFVHKLEGTLEVESKLDFGSTFRIVLPVG